MSFILKYLFRVHVVQGQFLIRYLERWSAAFFACCVLLAFIRYSIVMVVFVPFLFVLCYGYFHLARHVFRAMCRVTDNGRGPVICNQLRPLVFRTLSFGVRRVLMWSWTAICILIIVFTIGSLTSLVESLYGDVRNLGFYLTAIFCVFMLFVFSVVSVLGVRALTEWTGIVTRSRAVACELKEMHVEPSYFVQEQSTDKDSSWTTLGLVACLLFVELNPLSPPLLYVFAALLPLVLVSWRLLGDGRGAGLQYSRWFFLIFLASFAGLVLCDVASLFINELDLIKVSCVLVEIFCLVLAVCTSEMCYAVMGKPDAADEQQTGQPDKEGEDVIVGNI